MSWDKTYDDGYHAYVILLPREKCSEEKDDDCDGNCSKRQGKFDVRLVSHNDNELNSETQEEKEVEFQQRDVNLIGQIPTLHAEICADMLVNGPRELIVEFPRNARQQNGP